MPKNILFSFTVLGVAENDNIPYIIFLDLPFNSTLCSQSLSLILYVYLFHLLLCKNQSCDYTILMQLKFFSTLFSLMMNVAISIHIYLLVHMHSIKLT